MQQYFDNILSKYQYGFCMGYNSQHCFLICHGKKLTALFNYNDRKMVWKCR